MVGVRRTGSSDRRRSGLPKMHCNHPGGSPAGAALGSASPWGGKSFRAYSRTAPLRSVLARASTASMTGAGA
jgi:hypothetical protein